MEKTMNMSVWKHEAGDRTFYVVAEDRKSIIGAAEWFDDLYSLVKDGDPVPDKINLNKAGVWMTEYGLLFRLNNIP